MSAYQSYYKNNKNEASVSSQYHRLFLLRDTTSPEGHVVYIIQGRKINDKLWNRDPLLRDYVPVTIGTFIALINALAITQTW